MSPSLLKSIIFAFWIFVFACALIFGLYLLIAGKFRLGKFNTKGMVVRLVGGIFILASTIFYFYWQRGFLHQYGLLIQAFILLMGMIVLWKSSEKPTLAEHLPAGTHMLKSGSDEPAYRLHLRLNKDGSGLLVMNAATVLHLNPSAAEFAYHMMKGTPPQDVAEQLSRRYRISQQVALRDFHEFRDRIQALIHTPDLDPVSFLNFERVAPHSQNLSAPLRLDCALTYRLPPGTQSEYAPTKRVDRELTTEEWQSIMDKAWKFGIPHIIFTGGEPTLREDLFALIAHTEKNGQVCGLLTDGMKLVDKEYLQTLLQTGLDHLLIILQPDNNISWKALNKIMPQDIFTTVHFTVTPKNIGSAEGVLNKLAQMDVKNISLSTSEASLKEAIIPLRNQAAGLGLTLQWDLPVPYSADNPVTAEVEDDAVPEGAGKIWLYVEPDGDVLPAQGEANKVLGNILRDPCEKIYRFK